MNMPLTGHEQRDNAITTRNRIAAIAPRFRFGAEAITTNALSARLGQMLTVTLPIDVAQALIDAYDRMEADDAAVER